MQNRGKLLICSILTVAVLAATVAWWHQYQQGRRVLALWGAKDAMRIRLADHCQLLQLDAVASDKEPSDKEPSDEKPIEKEPGLTVAGERYAIRFEKEIAQSSGFIHVRQALIQDASYDWQASPIRPLPKASWNWALRFVDADGSTLLLFDLERQLVASPELDVAANIGQIAAGLDIFLREQLDP